MRCPHGLHTHGSPISLVTSESLLPSGPCSPPQMALLLSHCPAEMPPPKSHRSNHQLLPSLQGRTAWHSPTSGQDSLEPAGQAPSLGTCLQKKPQKWIESQGLNRTDPRSSYGSKVEPAGELGGQTGQLRVCLFASTDSQMLQYPDRFHLQSP